MLFPIIRTLKVFIMAGKVTDPEVQQFLTDHEQEDEKRLLLKYQEVNGVPMSVIADQIRGKRKAKNKLPFLYNTPGVVYPPGLNLEQCSSEAAALYKTALLKKLSPNVVTCADLTGGFGVDTFFFSKLFKKVHYVEPDKKLVEITKHNHLLFGSNNIEYHSETADKFLNRFSDRANVIFVDPSRRTTAQRRVFKLSDCEPDVISLMPQLISKADIVLVKTSPLLDIQQGIRELKWVSHVFVVSLENDCKELLFLCRKEFKNDRISVNAVNLLKERNEEFSFILNEEGKADVTYSEPCLYLYEPNTSILKAGAFKTVSSRFGLAKIHPNTHLYTSKLLMPDFPGRIFEIKGFIKPNAKELKTLLPSMRANVMVRNFPLSSDALKAKARLKDGGDKFVIGFTSQSGSKLVLASRVR